MHQNVPEYYYFTYKILARKHTLERKRKDLRIKPFLEPQNINKNKIRLYGLFAVHVTFQLP